MRTTIRLLLAFALIFIFTISCNKENNEPQPGQKSSYARHANNMDFNQESYANQFAVEKFNSMIGSFSNKYSFVNNTWSYNFSGGTSGEGGQPIIGNGSFTANGVANPLVSGVYENYNDGWFDLMLMDKIPVGPDDELIGVNGIIFELVSNSVDDISTGAYYFSESEDPFTFDWASVVFNGNTDDEVYYYLLDGSISINKSGDIYSLYFEGELVNGNTVNGNYTGQLEEEN